MIFFFPGLFPLCFGIFDFEIGNNWYWFLRNLQGILLHGKDITFVFNRNNGLLDAMKKVFPTSFHACCLEYLKRNLRHNLGGARNGLREKMVYLFIKCAHAVTLELLSMYMVIIRTS